jgi:hypothetical protein
MMSGPGHGHKEAGAEGMGGATRVAPPGSDGGGTQTGVAA